MYLDTLHDYIAYNKEFVIFDYWRQAQKGAWPQKLNFEHFIHLGIFGNFLVLPGYLWDTFLVDLAFFKFCRILVNFVSDLDIL